MRDIILTCCKCVLFAAAFIPFLVVAWVMFPLLSWSWRIGAFLPLIVLILWGVLQFAVKLFAKIKERQGALQKVQAADKGDAPRLTELQKEWQEGIRTLKESHLKEEGDPLYVLPWFLVLGGEGSGKSAALNGARLSSPFAESWSSGATRTCAWRPYDQGVAIDTAGRYAVFADPASDGHEWRRFLWLIARSRKKRPLDGLVITLPADQLLRGDAQELEKYGRELRLRMEEIGDSLGVRVPVYLLVTKCDLVEGMEAFCAVLPAQGLLQPMGLASEDPSCDLADFLTRFWQAIHDRMGYLRLILLHRDAEPPPPELLLLPHRLRSMAPALDAFAQAAFGKNHYQQTPFLRGVYLASAGPAGSASACHGAGRGAPAKAAFLHDLFAKVLPADRGLCEAAPSAVIWRKRGAAAAVGAGMAFGLLLCMLLTMSFVRNVAVLRQAAQLTAASGAGVDAAAGVAALELQLSGIRAIEEKNRGWWLPRFGLERSIRVEATLKERYCRAFTDRFLARFDQGLADIVTGLTPSAGERVYGSSVLHLARRCNLLQARLAGEGSAALAKRPLPGYPAFATPLGDRPGTPFDDLYLGYLAWSGDERRLKEELSALQTLLKKALALRSADPAWLLGLVEWQLDASPVSLKQFWHGSRQLAAEPVIPCCFTRKGRELAAALFAEIASAAAEPGQAEREKEAFAAWYRRVSFAAWQRFALDLPAGEDQLAGVGEWRAAAERMAGDQGAYLGFMKMALSELGPMLGSPEIPPWVAQMRRFEALRRGAADGGVAAGEAKGRLVGSNRPGGIGGADPSREYLEALARMAPVARSRTAAYQMALQVFSEGPEVSKSPLFQALDAAQRLNGQLPKGEADATFSRLIAGPIAFYGTFLRMEAACALQAKWEEKVLREVQGASDPQSLGYLLGKDGPVWKYVGEVADPFLGWSQGRGYYAKSALGGSIPFRPEFYSFLAKGTKAKVAAASSPKGNYRVTITGLPTDANPEAKMKPQGTRLELLCATGSQVMANLNYPVTRPFVWSPESCSDVSLQVEVGDTVLDLRYQGFPSFLRDFHGGSRTLYAAQFPGQKEALERMGVRFVRVNYRITGASAITDLQEELPSMRLPARIADCWDPEAP